MYVFYPSTSWGSFGLSLACFPSAAPLRIRSMKLTSFRDRWPPWTPVATCSCMWWSTTTFSRPSAPWWDAKQVGTQSRQRKSVTQTTLDQRERPADTFPVVSTKSRLSPSMELSGNSVFSGNYVSKPGQNCQESFAPHLSKSLPWVGIWMGYIRISQGLKCKMGTVGTPGHDGEHMPRALQWVSAKSGERQVFTPGFILLPAGAYLYGTAWLLKALFISFSIFFFFYILYF